MASVIVSGFLSAPVVAHADACVNGTVKRGGSVPGSGAGAGVPAALQGLQVSRTAAQGEHDAGERLHHRVKRTQMLAEIGIDFFQDLLSLEPRQRWERQLFLEIDRCDVFFLFWSSAAKKSEWVLKEVQYAMAQNGGDDEKPPEILPVVIEGPPPVEAPPELAHLHLNDRITYFMQATRKKWFSRLGRRG